MSQLRGNEPILGLNSWIGGNVNKVHLMKEKKRLSHKCHISLERNQQRGGIAGVRKEIKVRTSCELEITQDH
jgi:hypothetical protein